MSNAVNDHQVEEYNARFQAWLRDLNEAGTLERFFGEMAVSSSPNHDDYGRGVSLREEDGQMYVCIDEVTVYGAYEVELSKAEFDDELVLAGDWNAVAAALSEEHFGEWFFGDQSGVAASLADEAAEAADVPVEVAESFIEVSEYHRSPVFSAEQAEDLAIQHAPEIARLAGLTATERIEAVIGDFVSYLAWLEFDVEEFTYGTRRMARLAVGADEEEDFISSLAEEAHVYDDEAELHIQFTKPAEVNA